MAKPRLAKVNFTKFFWTHISHPTELETNQLAHLFKFQPADLKEILPPVQRPKLVERDNYIFMILLYPLYDRSTRKIHPVEVDFLIGQDFLISSSSEEYAPISGFFNHFKKETEKKDSKNLPVSAVELLFELLQKLEQYCLPMSIHISNDIDKVENEVFASTAKEETINEVLRIKTNIVNFRKSMNRHTRVLQHLIGKISGKFSSFTADKFKDLVYDTEDLWEMLENYQDTIEAIHDSQLSLLNYRSNATMQIFTIFTSIIFSLELAIGLISLFTDESLLFYGDLRGVLAVSGALALIWILMVFYFKKKRWL
ncbi:MAG: Mg2 transporter protein CorA family protein [Candidatus Magasanikbacteria bacterium GW2011_GWC2_40_17]|uniref:Mg2 transporter protein CorA family protein n=1 Tax=Candidatus Magasanikbacteria bacterium GW2011_GWA2_42_32 TaxID=1619039 RepID=A0A0G1A994_9BACT|nr:MAG: Mg2 transporter protein CorA family protein [Candidatus Magasanikbacteria bacterium GW2011_GWC2_40_17]KKS57559.1 MAG: Mg2 transporter protein CorA family protein [Candidatus Magasanikbacteria bacterium GW2011_GWA2_42_32]OGH85435.1 MAG: hypothetical protein A2294_03450 [Candidatus Magasanikbacteria bacterium RIFOXYB2_FULL_38_10]